ncbi:HlyD family secretion protein [Prosthecomicrobium hirschii]|uniref:HlyD family secretion protein n=1 Tax=Prosthecodimorpha hirschii TaxID=665126 RepID=UPI00221FE752|nr:HlyD family secretion protein [Prosthecomicrobium hirschii]
MATPFSQTLRSLSGDSPRRAHAAWLAALALAALWLAWLQFGSVTVYEISTRARLEALDAPHPVAARVASTVLATHLSIGRAVAAGDVLVEFDAAEERFRLAEEEARADALTRRVEALRAEIAAHQEAKAQEIDAARAAAEGGRSRILEAEIALQLARDSEKRVAKLSASGSASAVEASRTAADALRLAAVRDALVAETRRTEIAARMRAAERNAQIEGLLQSVAGFEGDIAASRNAARRLAVAIETHRVRAPVSGRIGDALPLSRGAYVAEGQRVATVIPEGGLIAVGEFDPAATVGRIRAGQHAVVRLDGFPWTRFGTVSATVTRVASEVRDGRVRVEFGLSSDAARVGLQHGLPGSIEVVVEDVAPVALVLRAVGLILAEPVTVAHAVGDRS